MVEELHGWADSFDADVTRTVEAGDPTLRQVTADLQASSGKVLRISSDLETLSWSHIQQDHEEAQNIANRAKWILSVVSGLTLVLSVWISFILPRRVIKPLTDLKEAVDHAAAGNYEIEFDLRGGGEVVDLANSVRNLICTSSSVLWGMPILNMRRMAGFSPKSWYVRFVDIPPDLSW